MIRTFKFIGMCFELNPEKKTIDKTSNSNLGLYYDLVKIWRILQANFFTIIKKEMIHVNYLYLLTKIRLFGFSF